MYLSVCACMSVHHKNTLAVPYVTNDCYFMYYTMANRNNQLVKCNDNSQFTHDGTIYG